MWLDNLKELKSSKGMTAKQIADRSGLPERTVKRVLSGDTANPYLDTLQRIATALDSSLDAILADTKAVVGTEGLATLQAEVTRVTAELELVTAENVILKGKVDTLTAENDLLRMKLEHKEEIIALHNYYIKSRPVT